MPRHASTCLCEACERDGTGEFADRDACALACVIGCEDTALQVRLFQELIGQRERLPMRRDCALDLTASGRTLGAVQARR